ncbi:3-oxoacyl-ACP reductase [Paenibacillus sp. CAA11]|uniref:SDR family oxidoreductase n=1 Tax=Paenibacillus sp. CAA11 TaxID=1532905 RepID=UPI000D3D4815|nr:SDR family oxidoreductase [Paenibacillus sp. CAA11]AWB46305.1 3-oxoacyl-ACP reductase [Paenibacillus sp. CAA11]
MDMGLQGKKALVIASSRGLGKAIAGQLAAEGADVMLSSRSGDKLQEVQAELQQLGAGTIHYYPADITSKEEIDALVKHTGETFGKIDILVNNAGGPPSASFEELDDEAWQKAFELNLLSYVRLTRAVLPYMKGLGGRIVNLASISVKQPIPGLILSNTFRMGIVGLTKTLSRELAPYSILVNTIAPGKIETDRIAELNQSRAEKSGQSVESISEQEQSKIPLGRYGTPEEFARAALFLLSGANTYITGTTLVVDGGLIEAI